MSINRQQKNIVNPYAHEDIEYDYVSNKRNIFVISAIHEYYLFSHNFPVQNQILKLSIPELQALGVEKDTPDLTVRELDIQAYATLYPQNCAIVDVDGVTKLETIGDQRARAALARLARRLEERNQLHLYSTNSSPTAILPENINNISESGAVSRLIAINHYHSANYKKLIYRSLDIEGETSLDDFQSVENLSLSVTENSFVNSNNNVDIYDWRENCKPGSETNKIYFNTVDDKFYYTTRTEQSESQLYDRSFWGDQMEDFTEAAFSALRTGVSEILKHTGRFSEANLQNILSRGVGEAEEVNKINFLSHLDIRPGSRWIHAVRVSRRVIESLEQNNDAFVSYDDFELVPLQKAQILLDPNKNKAPNKNVIKAENLLVHLASVTKTLVYYFRQLSEEEIRPQDISGINLRTEASTIDGFIDDLSLACLYNKTQLDDEDIIEFFFTQEFTLEYFTFNGYLMSRGIGNVKFYNDTNDEKPSKILNAFSDSTPTTFSVIYNNEMIYNDAKNSSLADGKPWLMFFEDYIYPPINLSPEKIRHKSLQSRASERSKRRNDIYTKVTEVIQKGEDYKRSEAARKRAIPSGEYNFYNVSSNLVLSGVDCNTAQAKLLKDTLKAVSQVVKKKDIRNALRQAIMILRDQLVKDTATRALLTRRLGEEENSQLALREIERQINQEIFCGLDVLGNVIETTFLDAKDMNPKRTAGPTFPSIKSLKVDLSVPKGYKGTYKTLFKSQGNLYEDVIKKAVLGFIESLFAGIMKDVINSILGCGPESKKAESLDDALVDLKFGVLNLNSYVEDLNLIEIAKSVDLVNVTRTNVDGQIQETKQDPTDVQITSLITDVSNMCTPREIDLLIFGAAGDDLYQLILETIDDGLITFPVNINIDPNGEEQVETRTINPEIYELFEFSSEKIRDFFAALGDAMRDEGIENIAQLNVSPLDAYCSTKDPDLGLDRLGFTLSPEQLEAQYISIIDAKKEKIGFICDLLQDLENIQKRINEYMNELGLPEWYEEVLGTLSAISNALNSSFLDWINGLFDKETTNNSSEVFNMYMTRFGQELFYTVRDLISKRIMVPTVVGASGTARFSYQVPSKSIFTDAPVSSLSLPYPPPEVIDDNSSWWWAGTLDDIVRRKKDFESTYALRTAPETLRSELLKIPRNGEGGYNVLYDALQEYKRASHELARSDQWISNNASTGNAKCYLVVDNLQNASIRVTRDVRNSKTGRIERKTIAQYIPKLGDVEPEEEAVDYHKMLRNIGDPFAGGPISESGGGQIMPSRNNPVVLNLLKDSMFGTMNYIRAAGVDIPPQSRGAVRNSPHISVANYTQFIDQQLNFIFATDEGKSRFKSYMRGVIRPQYEISDEECVNNKEAAIASAMVLMVQARLQRFFTNVVSLASPYPYWNSLGTRKLVTDYLFRKIYEEFEDRGLSNLIFEYADVFKKAFADEPDNNITLGEYDTPREFIRQLVEQVYLSMLKNASDSYYSYINTSPYSKSTTRDRYEQLLSNFYNMIIFAIERHRETFGLENTGESINFIRNEIFDENENITETGFYYGNYYFPMGLLIGQYLIAQDSLVNISRNFGRIHYSSLSQEASYDDAFLTAISEQEVSKFSSELVGMPTTLVRRVPGGTERVDVTYYRKSEVAKRVQQLSIQTGIDSENFIAHLEYLFRTIEDGSNLDESFVLQMTVELLRGMVDGTLPQVQDVLPSRLSWFSLEAGNLDVQIGEMFVEGYQQFLQQKSQEDPDGRTASDLFLEFSTVLGSIYLRRDADLQEKNDLERVLRT